jgi:predicted dehydrogenase/threonine dehydrogenase-like Zn-dependent dehydrogenase
VEAVRGVKQVLVKKGGVVVEEVPAPALSPRSLLVAVRFSCLSAGTESAGVRLSGLPLYRRALKQPHHARRALQLAREQGYMRVYKRVRGQLAAGVPTGYSAAGSVVGVGEEVEGFGIGDRVACAGAGIANHAEVIAVPVNLAVKVPDGVSLEHASSVTLGAIALQGVRRLRPTLGETIGVSGLGILGQLTVQLLAAAGCRVVGTDPDASRVERALAQGMHVGVGPGESLVERGRAASGGFGLDAVVITAATPSSEVVSEAFQACRKKGRVVLVGDVGLDLDRHDIYEKELDFLVSTSYGPGRYDATYELEGRDYPIGYVRWTENRNMEEYLRLLADGRVQLAGLGEALYPIDAAPDAYAALGPGAERPLLVLLSYSDDGEPRARRVDVRRVQPQPGKISVALVGAGSFALATHAPNLRKLREHYEIRAVVNRSSASAKAAALNVEAAYAATDIDEVLGDPEIDLVLISTRHDVHGRLALEALEAGKHAFVEKPLALTEEELEALEAFYAGRDSPLLMTGFNRRFSPAMRTARGLLEHRLGPLIADYRMNAGYIPLDHWVHGPEGGGRNLGEACHVYDVFDYLTAAEVTAVSARAVGADGRRLARSDNFVATIAYDDGSVCALTYTALGNREHAKERMDVFADGVVLTLDDYRELGVAGPGRGWSAGRPDKGHLAELEALAHSLRDGGPWPITLEEQLRASRIALAVEAQLRGG